MMILNVVINLIIFYSLFLLIQQNIFFLFLISIYQNFYDDYKHRNPITIYCNNFYVR